jgi:hypothetical protein
MTKIMPGPFHFPKRILRTTVPSLCEPADLVLGLIMESMVSIKAFILFDLIPNFQIMNYKFHLKWS